MCHNAVALGVAPSNIPMIHGRKIGKQVGTKVSLIVIKEHNGVGPSTLNISLLLLLSWVPRENFSFISEDE